VITEMAGIGAHPFRLAPLWKWIRVRLMVVSARLEFYCGESANIFQGFTAVSRAKHLAREYTFSCGTDAPM
jgi:hypothetical protein